MSKNLQLEDSTIVSWVWGNPLLVQQNDSKYLQSNINNLETLTPFSRCMKEAMLVGYNNA